MEKIVETKICKHCNSSFEITDKEKEFIEKFGIPNIEECYLCQLKQMMAFWPSIGKWHNRKCNATGETIITNYSSNSRFPVYKKEYFHSDKWIEPFMNLDMNKSFFSQLKKLQEMSPRPHQLGDNIENCLFCDDAWNSKNCYLSSSFLECEDLYYSYRCIKCNNCTDLVFCWDCSMSTDLTYSRNCYKVSYSVFVNNSNNSLFLYDCENIENCFMCYNLRNKKYCIKNKQHTKEEYFKKLEKYNFGSRKQVEILKSEFDEILKNEAFHKQYLNLSCEKVSGNFLTTSKNISNSFFIENGEDSINMFRGLNLKNSMNILSSFECEKIYLLNMCGYQYNVKFSSYSIRCKNSEYLDNCVDVENCFLCVGLRNKKYCILNKQYTKEEYEKLLPKLKLKMWKQGEYGKFLPYSMMYTEYNSTLARFYFPETKENIEKLGGYYENPEINNKIIEEKLEDNINDINTENNGIETICIKTGKRFNYINQVITLHKKFNLPLFSIFHLDRIITNYSKYLTGIKKQKTKCFISGKEIEHYYKKELGYKKIISNEEYQKIINS